MKKFKCTRCGACCISGPCSSGIENENGVCKFLEVHKNRTTSCQLVVDHKIDFKKISLNGGCAYFHYFKDCDYLYNRIRESRDRYIDQVMEDYEKERRCSAETR